MQSSLLSELQVAPKYCILKAFSSICIWRDSCLWQVAKGFTKAILIIHRIYNSEEHSLAACFETDSSWNQTMIHYWPQFFSVSDVINIFGKTLWWQYIVLQCRMNCTFWMSLGLLQGTGISEDSSGSSNIETFSSVIHILPKLKFICQVTNTENGQIASSFRLTNILYRLIAFYCIHQYLGGNGLLHLLHDQLVDCVEVIE